MNRVFSIVAVAVAVLVIGAVYESERRYDAAEAEARAVEHEIAATRRDIHVLNVEWAYLTRPERIEALAVEYLDLQPTEAARVVATPSAVQPTIDRLNGVLEASGRELAK